MVNPSYRDTALRYCVDDLPSANVAGTRLQNILGCIQLGKPLTQLSVSFLQQQGLDALHRFASGLLPYDRFKELALSERATRLESAEAAKMAPEIEDRAREVAMQARMKWLMSKLKRLAWHGRATPSTLPESKTNNCELDMESTVLSSSSVSVG